jgi:hypothetical protein
LPSQDPATDKVPENPISSIAHRAVVRCDNSCMNHPVRIAGSEKPARGRQSEFQGEPVIF